MISEEEWKNIEETLFLYGIPRYVDNIKKIDAEENWMDTIQEELTGNTESYTKLLKKKKKFILLECGLIMTIYN